jgi:tetratricopeptide (TPR) repeat protein
LAEAKAAAEQAVRLRPDLPDGHVALGYFYYWGKLDYDRALQELAIARQRQPNNPDLVFATAAVQRRQGRWPEAVANFERAVQLDPRSSETIRNLAETYSLLRKYDLGCSTADRGISIGPDIAGVRWTKIQCLVGKGSIPEAKQALQDAVKAVGFAQMSLLAVTSGAVASFGVTPTFLFYGDPAYQSKLEQLTLADFTDTIGLYSLKADMFRMKGRPAMERAYLDSARTILESLVQAHPEEANFHSRLGLIYAYLGRKADAVREGQTAVKLLPVSREAYRGANLEAALAVIYATVGMKDQAVDRLKYLLTIPSQISPGLLQSDPRWSALKGDERFQKLLRNDDRGLTTES